MKLLIFICICLISSLNFTMGAIGKSFVAYMDSNIPSLVKYVNEAVDNAIKMARHYRSGKEMDPIKLQYLSSGKKTNVNLLDGTLVGIQSLHRSGNVGIKYKNGAYDIEVPIDAGNLNVSYKYKKLGKEGVINGAYRNLKFKLKAHVDLRKEDFDVNAKAENAGIESAQFRGLFSLGRIATKLAKLGMKGKLLKKVAKVAKVGLKKILRKNLTNAKREKKEIQGKKSVLDMMKDVKSQN